MPPFNTAKTLLWNSAGLIPFFSGHIQIGRLIEFIQRRKKLIPCSIIIDGQMAGHSVSWFPTIFPDRCDGCEKLEAPRCIRFCPNGVFEIMEGKAVVAHPSNCMNGCNACEPICPHKAISFPKTGQTLQDSGESWNRMLHKVACTICGKEFWTNTDTQVCFDCKRKS